MKIICDCGIEAKDTYAGDGFASCSYKCPECGIVWQVRDVTAWADDSAFGNESED